MIKKGTVKLIATTQLKASTWNNINTLVFAVMAQSCIWQTTTRYDKPGDHNMNCTLSHLLSITAVYCFLQCTTVLERPVHAQKVSPETTCESTVAHPVRNSQHFMRQEVLPAMMTTPVFRYMAQWTLVCRWKRFTLRGLTWTWIHKVPPKRWYLYTNFNGVAYYMTRIVNLHAHCHVHKGLPHVIILQHHLRSILTLYVLPLTPRYFRRSTPRIPTEILYKLPLPPIDYIYSYIPHVLSEGWPPIHVELLNKPTNDTRRRTPHWYKLSTPCQTYVEWNES
jgi:hypothetical protein